MTNKFKKKRQPLTRDELFDRRQAELQKLIDAYFLGASTLRVARMAGKKESQLKELYERFLQLIGNTITSEILAVDRCMSLDNPIAPTRAMSIIGRAIGSFEAARDAWMLTDPLSGYQEEHKLLFKALEHAHSSGHILFQVMSNQISDDNIPKCKEELHTALGGMIELAKLVRDKYGIIIKYGNKQLADIPLE